MDTYSQAIRFPAGSAMVEEAIEKHFGPVIETSPFAHRRHHFGPHLSALAGHGVVPAEEIREAFHADYRALVALDNNAPQLNATLSAVMRLQNPGLPASVPPMPFELAFYDFLETMKTSGG